MKASENGLRPSYIPPFLRRKHFCRKVRETEIEVRGLEKEGKWAESSRFRWALRNAWWGYKRYGIK
jgi:hypothetical protein